MNRNLAEKPSDQPAAKKVKKFSSPRSEHVNISVHYLSINTILAKIVRRNYAVYSY